MKEPPRKSIPDKLKLEIYLEHNGRCARTGKKLGHYSRQTEYNHNPPLKLRAINEDGTDYVPPQLDPAYIEPLMPSVHDAVTNGDDSLEKGHMLRKDYDKARISKTKRVRESHGDFRKRQASKQCGQKRERSGKWPSRPFGKRPK